MSNEPDQLLLPFLVAEGEQITAKDTRVIEGIKAFLLDKLPSMREGLVFAPTATETDVRALIERQCQIKAINYLVGELEKLELESYDGR
jgi:hypothetical protein